MFPERVYAAYAVILHLIDTVYAGRAIVPCARVSAWPVATFKAFMHLGKALFRVGRIATLVRLSEPEIELKHIRCMKDWGKALEYAGILHYCGIVAGINPMMAPLGMYRR